MCRAGLSCHRPEPEGGGESVEITTIIGSIGTDVGPTEVIRGWHGLGWTYNRAFVDGHVAYQPVIEWDTRDVRGFYEHYRVERLINYPGGAVSMVEAQKAFACITVRGDGWQKDTLPAPPVPVEVYPPLDKIPGTTRVSYENCVQEAGWQPMGGD